MKLLFIIFFSSLYFLSTGCVKDSIAPVSSKNDTGTQQTAALNTYDWYNGTKGTALIQVTCTNCNALATIGNVTTPFLFNEQGVAQLKYTPASGLAINIAVCPGSVKAIKAEIFNAANTSLYTYSDVSSNWNNTYVIK